MAATVEDPHNMSALHKKYMQAVHDPEDVFFRQNFIFGTS